MRKKKDAKGKSKRVGRVRKPVPKAIELVPVDNQLRVIGDKSVPQLPSRKGPRKIEAEKARRKIAKATITYWSQRKSQES